MRGDPYRSCAEALAVAVGRAGEAKMFEREGVPESSIRLPVARLALAFRFINGRELIEEPPPPEPVKPEVHRKILPKGRGHQKLLGSLARAVTDRLSREGSASGAKENVADANLSRPRRMQLTRRSRREIFIPASRQSQPSVASAESPSQISGGRRRRRRVEAGRARDLEADYCIPDFSTQGR